MSALAIYRSLGFLCHDLLQSFPLEPTGKAKTVRCAACALVAADFDRADFGQKDLRLFDAAKRAWQ